MMRIFIGISCAFLLSCSSNEADSKEMNTGREPIQEIVVSEKPERSQFVDEAICGELELEYGKIESGAPSPLVYVNVEGEKHQVKKYEGTLMRASGIEGMFLLRFNPYSYWDENLEVEVKSAYDFDLNLFVSKEQNNVLGFVDYTKANNNIAWDYFENLFSIYYFENDEGETFPLKFLNQGKTEWDG